VRSSEFQAENTSEKEAENTHHILFASYPILGILPKANKLLETIILFKEELMAKLQRLDCKKKSEGVKGVGKSSRV
jgi:hypothetical protein